MLLGPRGESRLAPAMPVTAYKTFGIVSPSRPATCEEVDCDHYLRGWAVPVDEATELGQRQAAYFRTGVVPGLAAGRRMRCTEERRPDGLTVFTFEAGQRCFRQHRLPMEGRERFGERDGDWRGNPTGRVVQHSPQGWTDSFGEHQEKLADAQKRG